MADSSTETFFESVWGDAEGRVSIWWRDGVGKNSPVNRQQWFDYPQQLTEIAEFAESKASKDVYFSVATYTEDKRKPEFAKQAQVIFQDTDAMNPEDYRIEPSIVVESSPGRFHCYWMLDEVQDAKDSSDLTKIVTYAHLDDGTDVSSWSVNKLLRVPGTSNTSYDFPTTVTADITGTIYTLDEVAEAYSDVRLPERAKRELAVLELEHNVEHPAMLPDYEAVLEKLDDRLMDLATTAPVEHSDGSQNRSELRYRLLCDLIRHGLDFDEVVSVAWHSPAASKWSQEDRRGISGLVMEVNKALAEVNAEHGLTINTPDNASLTAPPADDESGYRILLPEEAKRALEQENEVTRYLAFCKEKSGKKWNRSYDLANGWTLLSLFYSSFGFIPVDDGTGGMDCSLYIGIIGESGSGKSTALSRMKSARNAIMVNDQMYDGGWPGSPEAFIDKLASRDRRPLLMFSDEVHGWFDSVKVNSRLAPILPLMAEAYDGTVAPRLMKSLGEKSGVQTHPRVTTWMQGTSNLYEHLDKTMYSSGFLPRFLWVVGDPPERLNAPTLMKMMTGAEGRDEDDVIDPFIEKMRDRTWDNWRKLGAQAATDNAFGAAISAGDYPPQPFLRSRRAVGFTKEALALLARAEFTVTTMVDDSHPKYDILGPSLRRFAMNMYRASTLLAMSNGRTTVEEDDVLFALLCGEEWLPNLFMVASKVASSFVRLTQDVMDYINKHGGKVSKAAAHNEFIMEPQDWNKVQENLIQRGLLMVEGGDKDPRYVAKARSRA